MLQVPFDGLAGLEAEGSAPKGTGPLFLCLSLDRPVPIFLGQPFHKCNSTLNRLVQILL